MTRRFEPLVLCYHAVSPTWTHALSVDPPVLARQIRALLRRRWRPARAEDVVGGAGRLLHVTFDDAYTSVTAALPILERLGVPATVFACSSFADEGRPLVVPELSEEPRAELATMDWSALGALADRGVEIGAHTETHPHLPRLTDAEIDRELRDSRARIEESLGRACRFLAYPYGEEQPRIRAAAQRAGFIGAFALPGRRSRPDPFAIPRVGMYRADGRIKTWAKTTPLVDRVHPQAEPAV